MIKALTTFGLAIITTCSVMGQVVISGNAVLSGNQIVSAALPVFTADSSTFDGVNDYLGASSMSGAANSKVGTISCWYKDASSSGTRWSILSAQSAGTTFLNLHRFTDNKIYLNLRNAAGTIFYQIPSAATWTDSSWHHLYVSWDAAAGAHNMYIDGVNVKGTVSTASNDTAQLTDPYEIGSEATTFKFNGCLTQITFYNTYLDSSWISTFRGTDGRPKDLGTGVVNGVTPLIFCKMLASNAGLNNGSGGNFTVNSGPYTSCTAP